MSTGPVVIGINPNKFVYNGKIMTAHVVPTIPDYYEKINLGQRGYVYKYNNRFFILKSI